MSSKNGDFNWKEGVTLKEYLEDKMDLQFESRDKALELQAGMMNTRLDALNEWRQQNRDERQTFLTKSEYDSKHQLLENKMEAMQKIIWLALGALIVIDYIIKFLK